MPLKKLSVIIPTFNRAATLRITLFALSHQNPKPFQVIIVNNGIDAKTDSVVSSFKKSLPIHYYSELRKGPSFARNLGFRHATGDIIVFLDDDCIPEKNWSREIIKTYRLNPHLHHVFRVRYTHVFPNSNVLTEMFYFRNIHSTVRAKPITGLKGFTVVEGAPMGCCFMNRRIPASLPYVFDEQLFPFIGEELDFSIRVQLSGVIILMHPRVMVTHIKQAAHSSIKSLRNAFFVGRALGLTREKNRISSSIARIFSKEIDGLRKDQFFIIWNYISIFKKQYRNKSFSWKLAALLHETARSIVLYAGYVYAIVWYRVNIPSKSRFV